MNIVNKKGASERDRINKIIASNMNIYYINILIMSKHFKQVRV